MSRRLFQLVALAAVLLHLADGLLASWGHSHLHAHGATEQAKSHACHHHHGECGHDHDDADEPEEQDHSLPGQDDADHCAACRHLAQASVHQFVLIELPTIEKVAPLCCRVEVAAFTPPAHDYLSRGPPATAL